MLFKDNYDQEMINELNPIAETKLFFKEKSITKYLTFDFRSIDSDNGTKKDIMITVRDITEQVILKQKLKESQEDAKRQMESFIGILHIDPPMLREFIESSSSELESVEKLLHIDKKKSLSASILKDIYRSIHMIKGNASLLAFKVFAEQAHSFEDTINDLSKKDSLSKTDMNLLKTELSKIKRLLNDVNNLLDRIGKIHEQMRPRRSFERDVMIQSLNNLVEQSAQDEGKNVNLDATDFKIEQIPHKERIFVKDIMIQLLRNAVAHGIELPKERKGKKKPARASIKIETFTINSSFGFSIRDDGRGIQLEKLKEKAVKSGKATAKEIEKWEQSEIVNVIFEQGISTTDKANMVSGRGVGMDIVHKKVSSRNGKIDVRFEQDKFCEFKISIPKKNGK
jgi:Amt family ammonium transporter